ncbi:hypothetical protein ACT4VM_00675 [Acinetobacter baumannii]|nr:hypothetical protein [Acinetobacter baumannii]
MTDLNKEREVNLRFEQDDGAVWVFDGDSQQGTEISHLMMMHADEYSEDELRVICHHAACEIDRLRAELEKAKAQAVPDTHVVVPRTREVVVAIEKMVEQQVEASGITSDVFRLDGWRILDAIQEASESGAEG